MKTTFLLILICCACRGPVANESLSDKPHDETVRLTNNFTNTFTNLSSVGWRKIENERILWEGPDGKLYIVTETQTNAATCKDLEEAIKMLLKRYR